MDCGSCRRVTGRHYPALRYRDCTQSQRWRRTANSAGLPGAASNITDLLYLKDMDLAIVHADVFEHLKTLHNIPDIEKKINFISTLQISELHVLVRPEIKSFEDLEGKKVSFNTAGAGPTITGPILFQRLGVKVEPVYVNNAIALEQMKSGAIVALLHTVGKPNELLAKFKNDYGFNFLVFVVRKIQVHLCTFVLHERGLSCLGQAGYDGRNDRRPGCPRGAQLGPGQRPLSAGFA